MSNATSRSVLVVTLLAFGMSGLAGCGGRVELDASPGSVHSDAAAPSPSTGTSASEDQGGNSRKARNYPCGFSRGTERARALETHSGACEWHEAEPPDLDSPNMQFQNVEQGILIDLTLIDGPEQCDATTNGWYVVDHNVGVVKEAPVVATFRVCPDTCARIEPALDEWIMGFTINTCH